MHTHAAYTQVYDSNTYNSNPNIGFKSLKETIVTFYYRNCNIFLLQQFLLQH